MYADADPDVDADDGEQPSLGLAGALDFLAAERARFLAQRGHAAPASDGTWQHVVPARRKRRRRRNRSAQGREEEGGAAGVGSFESSSDDAAPREYYQSTPPSPPGGRARGVVHHSKSTPTLRLPVECTMPIDPRVLHMRNLANKLRMLFPAQKDMLESILTDDQPDAADFVDPRGPVPCVEDTPIHVFIDQYVSLVFHPLHVRSTDVHTLSAARTFL